MCWFIFTCTEVAQAEATLSRQRSLEAEDALRAAAYVRENVKEELKDGQSFKQMRVGLENVANTARGRVNKAADGPGKAVGGGRSKPTATRPPAQSRPRRQQPRVSAAAVAEAA